MFIASWLPTPRRRVWVLMQNIILHRASKSLINVHWCFTWMELFPGGHLHLQLFPCLSPAVVPLGCPCDVPQDRRAIWCPRTLGCAGSPTCRAPTIHCWGPQPLSPRHATSPHARGLTGTCSVIQPDRRRPVTVLSKRPWAPPGAEMHLFISVTAPGSPGWLNGLLVHSGFPNADGPDPVKFPHVTVGKGMRKIEHLCFEPRKDRWNDRSNLLVSFSPGRAQIITLGLRVTALNPLSYWGHFSGGGDPIEVTVRAQKNLLILKPFKEKKRVWLNYCTS